MKLEVFEPAMCCPTGVCGVNLDSAMVQFNADVQWLAAQGVEVKRHSLSHDAGAFAASPAVVRELESGLDRLPITTADGRVVSTGMYPTRDQLASKLGIAPSVATAAATGPGCGCKPGKCC
jgi:hypothetical protein